MPGAKRIGILGTTAASQVAELQAAFAAQGAETVLVDPKRIGSYLPAGKAVLRRRDGPRLALDTLDALLLRSLPGGSLEQVIYRLDVLHRLAAGGLPVINSGSVLEKTVDKFLCTALLAEAGLPVPRTAATECFDEALDITAQWGSIVVKPVFGSLGRGIARVDDPDVAYRVFRALEMGRYLYYIQEYLPHGDEDYRLFVLGGQVIGAMRRHGGGWKTNISLGAVAEPCRPDAELERLALAAAGLLSADYLGVDILISNGRPYLIELNGIPGWAGLQTVVADDIAALLAEYVLTGVNRHAKG